MSSAYSVPAAWSRKTKRAKLRSRRGRASKSVKSAAEGTERAWALALLTGIAHVIVLGVLGFADPLPGRLLRGHIRGEVVPAARRAAAQRGAGDPVLAAALELGREDAWFR